MNATFTIAFNDDQDFSPYNSHSSSSSNDSPKRKRLSKIPTKSLHQSSNSSDSPREELSLPEAQSPPRVIPPVMASSPSGPKPPSRRKLKKPSPPKDLGDTFPSTSSSSAPTYRPGFSSQKSEPLPEIGSSAKYSGSNFLSNFDDTTVILEVPHPEQALQKVMDVLGGDSNEWQKKCEALVMLRRITGCHTEALLPVLHSVVILMEREVLYNS